MAMQPYSQKTLDNLKDDVATMRKMLPYWEERGLNDNNPFYKHTRFLLRYIEIVESVGEIENPLALFWRCYWCGEIGPEVSGEAPEAGDWLCVTTPRDDERMAFCCGDHKDKMFELQRWPLQP